MTDLAGSLNFCLLALAGLLWQGTWHPRQIVLTGLVLVWGVRLGVFLFVRVLLRGKDARFDGIREDALKFAGFWAIQVVWVWVVSLPVTFTNGSRDPGNPLGPVDYVGWSLWAVGLLIESIADQQRFLFNRRERSAGSVPFLRTGLWSVSRHPNYFGEITLWLGVWLSSSFGLWPVSVAAAILGFLSPALTALLLLAVSGMPLGERRDAERWGHLPAYQGYLARTSPIWPLPPALYLRLPWWIKKYLLLDRKYVLEARPSPETTKTEKKPNGKRRNGGSK